jgi:hypothetical protein
LTITAGMLGSTPEAKIRCSVTHTPTIIEDEGEKS